MTDGFTAYSFYESNLVNEPISLRLFSQGAENESTGFKAAIVKFANTVSTLSASHIAVSTSFVCVTFLLATSTDFSNPEGFG